MKYMTILVALIGFTGCNAPMSTPTSDQSSTNSGLTLSASTQSSASSTVSTQYNHCLYAVTTNNGTTSLSVFPIDPNTGDVLDQFMTFMSTVSGVVPSAQHILIHPNGKLLFLSSSGGSVGGFYNSYSINQNYIYSYGKSPLTQLISNGTLGSATISGIAFGSNGDLYTHFTTNMGGGTYQETIAGNAVNLTTGALTLGSSTYIYSGNPLSSYGLSFPSDVTQVSLGSDSYVFNSSTLSIDHYSGSTNVSSYRIYPLTVTALAIQ